MLKCSRCQRVFRAPGDEVPPRRAAAEEESPSFAFGDEDEWDAEPLTGSEVPEDTFSLNVPTATSRPLGSGRARSREAPEQAAPADPAMVDEREQLDDNPQDEDDELADLRNGLSLRPVFIFLILVVAAYGMLARTLYANPGWAQQVTGHLPVIGSSMMDRSLNRSVKLIDVHGRYERTKGGKLVLLINGKAINQSAVPLKKVLVSATLYDQRGQPVDEQATFCGNSVRLDLVRDLSIRQVAILKGLKPPPHFSVRPGAACPFVNIFTEPPATIETFTAEAVGAQHQT